MTMLNRSQLSANLIAHCAAKAASNEQMIHKVDDALTKYLKIKPLDTIAYGITHTTDRYRCRAAQ